MLSIYLLRHGQTAYNADNNRYCGLTNLPLTETGLQQAEQVRKQLQDVYFDAAYSSPLQRAYRTAEIIAGDIKVQADERLIEADFGQWEGKTREEFIHENPVSWEKWNADPLINGAGETGETARSIIERVDRFFEYARKIHPNGRILVVAHNAVNRFYLGYKLGMRAKDYRKLFFDNSSISVFTLDEDGEIVLQQLNSILPFPKDRSSVFHGSFY